MVERQYELIRKEREERAQRALAPPPVQPAAATASPATPPVQDDNVQQVPTPESVTSKSPTPDIKDDAATQPATPVQVSVVSYVSYSHDFIVEMHQQCKIFVIINVIVMFRRRAAYRSAQEQIALKTPSLRPREPRQPRPLRK